ncbi:MAG: RadC family protein [Nitrospinota bacterium]
MEPIKNWPDFDKPLVKLKKKGGPFLTVTELIALVLGYGHKNKNVIDIARDLVKEFKNLSRIEAVTIDELKVVEGIGEQKATRLKAALELGRRFIEEASTTKPVQFKTSKDVADYFKPSLKNLRKEIFKIGLLNVQNHIINSMAISEGGMTSATIRTAEIFSIAIKEGAAGVVLVHNHPSGNPNPSEEDRALTRKLVCAGNILDIKVIDHIIFGSNSWYSFLDNDEI